jgi:beta-ketoacyl-acyl-carrier-protein synthase II
MNRVVITGVGALTPVGVDAPSTWNALQHGTSGVCTITRFDTSDFPIRIAGELPAFTLTPQVDVREAKRMSLYVQYALNVVWEAVADAQLDMAQEDPDEVGVIFGTGAGGIDLIVQQQAVLDQKGYRRVAPLLIANMIDDSASGHIAIQLGARGPNMAVVSACSTGGHNIGEAYETIKRGDAQVIITGGSEAPILPFVLASFTNMKGLATDNEHPQQACKPFDANRDGFVLSEGAAALVLERMEHALARGAPILAEVVGYGSSNDARHMAAADEQGIGSARAMRMALRKARVAPSEVSYINAHGTGTPLNDSTETRAIKTVFGDTAYQIPVSSSKSMLGHMMGGAGAVEAVVCALSIRDGCIHPTINHTSPDPDCDLDYVTEGRRELPVKIALSNSIGLGGHNSCLVLRTFEQ